MLQKLVLVLSATLISDQILGRAVTSILSRPPPQIIQERTYRTRSDIYHHDLKKLVSSHALWGGRNVPFLTNSLGFRDGTTRTISIESKSHRLLFIGDSFTEGVGVEYKESFVGIVDQKLRRCGVEVLNAGVVSYSPSIYYRKVRYLIEEVGLGFAELIVFLDVSDIEDEAIYYDLDSNDTVVDSPLSPVKDVFTPTERARVERDKPLKTRLKESSVLLQIADFLKDRLVEGRPERSAPIQPTRSPIGLERSSWTFDDEIYRRYGGDGLEQARHAMELLLEHLRIHGRELTLVVYPWPDQIAARDERSRQVTYWKSWAARRRVRFVDLFPSFIRDADPDRVLDRYFIHGDIHFNEEGHRLVAEHFLRTRSDLRTRCDSPASSDRPRVGPVPDGSAA